MSREITVTGSIGQIMKQTGKSLAKAFLAVKHILIIDVSGSMENVDFPNGDSRSRLDRARDELAKVQANLQGQVLVISFSDDSKVLYNGVPSTTEGGTDMLTAFRLIDEMKLDGLDMTFTFISDGATENEEGCLRYAKTMKGAISCVYIGSDDPRDYGFLFMQKLAKAAGGTAVQIKGGLNLAATVQKLMLGEGKK